MSSKEVDKLIYSRLDWWMRDAARLSDMGRASEAEHVVSYDKSTVNRSIVYLREYVVMIVSLLDSMNKQLRWIRYILITILAFTTLKIIGGL